MTNVPNHIDADGEIIAEACAWVAQLESGKLTGSDLAALQEWMARSPAHKKEIRIIAELNNQLSSLTELAEPIRSASAAASALRKRSWVPAFAKPGFVMLGALVSAVALVALFISTDLFIEPVEIYRTSVGQYQTIELSDGTAVKLNTDSQIEVDYSSKNRRIRLIHGEAFFDVAKNPLRPFVVYSDQAKAEALGTSFVVRLRDSLTEIAVIEGVVAFSKLTEISSVTEDANQVDIDGSVEVTTVAARQVIINAGQVITSRDITNGLSSDVAFEVPTLTSREIQRKISWTEGLFDFSETRLEEVVREISRHNNVTIEIADPSLKDVEFGGMFRTGDVDSLLEALEGLNIDVVRDDHGVIQLHKNDNI
ncbi:MAG: FecR domain-containing protein [Rhodospirillaceae bacterium]